MPEFNEREYNVILHKGVDYDAFWTDLQEITNKDGIPNRQVEIANPRLGSYRQTHYWLTDTEKEELLNHDSVLDIEIPPEQRNDIVKEHGWRYMFRGLGVTLCRAFPVNAIIFPVYEFVLIQLGDSEEDALEDAYNTSPNPSK